MAWEEDISIFFEDLDAVDGVYTPKSGSPSTVTGYFDAAYHLAQLLASVGIDSSSPMFGCQTSMVQSAVEGETLTIGGTIYNIAGVHHAVPDIGFTVLILSRG